MKEQYQECELCNKLKPTKEFVNGHGESITWCKECGEGILKSLQMW